MQKTFPTLTSLKSGMKTNEVKFLDNDPQLPYVLGLDAQFYYFAQGTKDNNGKTDHFTDFYCLVLTSSKDLGVQA